jgi:hypothetical protein
MTSQSKASVSPLVTEPASDKSSYLLVAARASKVIRMQRRDVPGAFVSVRRLRTMGWAVVVLAPGSWA